MKRRVLVVDDDAPTRQMIAAVLSRSAFTVDVCIDDADAAERLAQDTYGAVVLALVSQNPAVHDSILRKVAETRRHPCVIIVSAGSQVAMDAAASKFIRARLRKPFQIEELVEAVKGCFEDESTGTGQASDFN